MAYENFTTWDEDDAGSHITVAANQIDFAGIAAGTENVDKDYGAGHFTGVFSHDLEIQYHTYVSAVGGVYAISNVDDCNYDNIGSADLGWLIYIWGDDIYIENQNGNDSWNGVGVFGVDTSMYLTIGRDASNYPYCKIYSDSGRLSLVDTITITTARAAAYRYISVAFNAYSGNEDCSVYNLDIKEAAAPSIVPLIMNYQRRLRI